MQIQSRTYPLYIAAIIERGHLYYLSGTKKTASTKEASLFENWTQAKEALKAQGYINSYWIIFEEDLPALKWSVRVTSNYCGYTLHAN